MKIIIDAPALRAALGGLVVPRSPVMPVLAHVLIITRGRDAVTIESNDTSLNIILTVPCEVQDEGAMVVEFARLKASVVGMEGVVSLAEAKAGATLSSTAKRGRFTLCTLPPGDFPSRDDLPTEAVAVPDIAGLAEAMATVLYAAGKNDVRQMVNGVQINPDSVCATNGHRAAWMPLASGSTHRLLIPAGSCERVIKALGDADSVHTLGETRPQALAVRGPGFTLRTQLLDVQAPDIARIVPADDGTPAMVVRSADILATLARLAPFADTTERLLMERDAAGLALITKVDMVEAREVVDISGAEPPERFGLNHRYLKELCTAAHGADVQMQFHDTRTLSVRFPNRADVHVVMGVVV